MVCILFLLDRADKEIHTSLKHLYSHISSVRDWWLLHFKQMKSEINSVLLITQLAEKIDPEPANDKS